MNAQFISLQQTRTMGKGIFANKDIPPNTTILHIQEEQYITYQRLSQNPLFNSLTTQLSISKVILFAFYLSYNSLLSNPTPTEPKLQQYIQQLPHHFNNLICWGNSQLRNIKDTQLVEKIERRRISIWDEYNRLRQYVCTKLKQIDQQSKDLKDQIHIQSKRTTRARNSNSFKRAPLISKAQYQLLQQVSYHRVLKFISAIESRSIYYQSCSDPNSQVGALIPFLQFFNHHNNAQCEVRQSTTCEKVITVVGIKKGEQIFVNYGKNLSLSQFLQYYGMIPFGVNAGEDEQCLHQGDRQNSLDQDNQMTLSVERKRLARHYNQIQQRTIMKSACTKMSKACQN